MSKSITITVALTIFHVARLKLFIGSFKSAYKHALRDNDQYVISEIKAYRGDPLPRTTIQFEFFFNDNTLSRISWNKDTFDTIPCENFCRSHPELYPSKIL